MARKKNDKNRANAASSSVAPPTAASASPAAPAPAAPALSFESLGIGGVLAVGLAVLLVLTPLLGVPNEEMLQDTLKSAVVSLTALMLALYAAYKLMHVGRPVALPWHPALLLPVLLMLWALGSMLWSHTYLAGVEAVRWFIFTLLAWLTLLAATRDRLGALALAFHLGGFAAALWGMAQFWVDLRWFPQGPNPASTFVNRNFAAEWVVMTLPFGVWAVLRARQSFALVGLSTLLALNVVFIGMTGTRSALAALYVLLVLLPWLIWRYWHQLPASAWPRVGRYAALGVFLFTVVVMGNVPTGNPALIQENTAEGRGLTAFQRAAARTGSALRQEEYTRHSFSLRLVMWKATGRVIAAHPLSGVGAGAWEVDIPLYQAEGSLLETDYYVHNEYLQLLAEYGLAGWAFLVGLLGWLLRLAWTTWRLGRASADGDERGQEAGWRAVALTSMLALLIVSAAGFPWRLATTGAGFAVLIGLLAASEWRLGDGPRSPGAARQALRLNPLAARILAAVLAGALMLGFWITSRAAEVESKLVRAVKIALTLTQSGQPNSPQNAPAKAQMLELLREGTALMPHYRKITPMAADELARWGDWNNAVWVWESVLSSRPYVVAILTNVARGHAQAGRFAKAREYLERARRIQPEGTSVRSLDVILLTQEGKDQQALEIIKRGLERESFDLDMLMYGFNIAYKTHNFALAEQTVRLMAAKWPARAAEAWMRMGHMWWNAAPGQKIEDLAQQRTQATQAYAKGLGAMPPAQRERVLHDYVPPELQDSVRRLISPGGEKAP